MAHLFSDYSTMPEQPVHYHGPVENITGAETAAFEEPLTGPVKAVLIGVATGVLTLIVNRWVEKLLK